MAKQIEDVQILHLRDNVVHISQTKHIDEMMVVEFSGEDQAIAFEDIARRNIPKDVEIRRHKQALAVTDHSEDQFYRRGLQDVSRLLELKASISGIQQQQAQLRGYVNAVNGLKDAAARYAIKPDRTYGLADREETAENLKGFLAAFTQLDKDGINLAHLFPAPRLIKSALAAIEQYSKYPSAQKTKENKAKMAAAIQQAEVEIIRLATDDHAVGQVAGAVNKQLTVFAKSLQEITSKSENLPESVRAFNNTGDAVAELRQALTDTQAYFSPITQALKDGQLLPELPKGVENAQQQQAALQKLMGTMQLVDAARSYEIKPERNYRRDDRKEIATHLKEFLRTYQALESGGTPLANTLLDPRLIDTVNTALGAIQAYKDMGKTKVGRDIMAVAIENAEAGIARLADKRFVRQVVQRTEGQLQDFDRSIAAIDGLYGELSDEAKARSGYQGAIEGFHHVLEGSRDHFQALEARLGVKEEAIREIATRVVEQRSTLEKQLKELQELQETNSPKTQKNFEKATTAIGYVAEIQGRVTHKSTQSLLEHFAGSEDRDVIAAMAVITSAQEALAELTPQAQFFQKSFPKPQEAQPSIDIGTKIEILDILSHKKVSILTQKGESSIYISFKETDDPNVDRKFSEALTSAGYPFKSTEYSDSTRTFTLNTNHCSDQLLGLLHQAAAGKKITRPVSGDFKQRLFSDPYYYLISGRSGTTDKEKTSMQAISSNAFNKLNVPEIDRCYNRLIRGVDQFVEAIFDDESQKKAALANGRLLFEGRYANKRTFLGYDAEAKWEDFNEPERLEATKRLFKFYVMENAVGGKCTIDQHDAFTQLMVFITDEAAFKVENHEDLVRIAREFYAAEAADVKDNTLKEFLLNYGKANAGLDPNSATYNQDCLQYGIDNWNAIPEGQLASLALQLIKTKGINKVDKPFAEKMHEHYSKQNPAMEKAYAGFVQASRETAISQVSALLYDGEKTFAFEEVNYDGVLIDKFAQPLAQRAFLRHEAGEDKAFTTGEKTGLQEALVMFDAGHHLYETYGIHPSSQIFKNEVVTSTITRPEDGSRISEYAIHGHRVVACEATYHYDRYYHYVADKAFGHSVEEGAPVLLSLTQEINNRTYDFKRHNELDSHHLNLFAGKGKELPFTLPDGTVVRLKESNVVYHPGHLEEENTLHDITENTIEFTRNGQTRTVKHYIYRGWADGRHLEGLDEEQTYQLMTEIFSRVEQRGLVISNCAEGIGRANASLVMGKVYKRVNDIANDGAISPDVAIDRLIQFYYSNITQEQLLQPVWDGVRKDAANGHQAMIKNFTCRLVKEKLAEKGLDQALIDQLIIDPHDTARQKEFNALTEKGRALTIVDLVETINPENRTELKSWLLGAGIEIPEGTRPEYWAKLETQYKDKDSKLHTVLDTRRAMIAEGVAPQPLDISTLLLIGQDALFNRLHDVPVEHYQQIGKVLSAAKALRSQGVPVGNLTAEQLSGDLTKQKAWEADDIAKRVENVLKLESEVKDLFLKKGHYQLVGTSFTADPFAQGHVDAKRACKDNTAVLESIKQNATELGLARVYKEEGLTSISEAVAFHQQEKYSSKTDDLGQPVYTATPLLTKKAAELTKRNVYETADEPDAIVNQAVASWQETTGATVPVSRKVAAGIANVSLAIASAPVSAARGFVSGVVEAGKFGKKLSEGQEVGSSVQEMFLSSMTAATGSSNMRAASDAIERQDPVEKGSKSGALKRFAATTLLTPVALVTMPVLGAMGVLGTSVTSAAKDTMAGDVAEDFRKKHRTWAGHTVTGLKRLVTGAKPKGNNDVNDVLRPAFDMLDKEHGLKVKPEVKELLRAHVHTALNSSLPADITAWRENPDVITPRAVAALSYELTRAMPLIIARAKQPGVAKDNVWHRLSNDVEQVMKAASVTGATAYEYNVRCDNLTAAGGLVQSRIRGGTKLQREEMRYRLQNVIREEYDAVFRPKATVEALENGQVVLRFDESDKFLKDRNARSALQQSLQDVARGAGRHLDDTGHQADINTWMKAQVRDAITAAYEGFMERKNEPEPIEGKGSNIEEVKSRNAQAMAIRDAVYAAVSLSTSGGVTKVDDRYMISFKDKDTVDFLLRHMQALGMEVLPGEANGTGLKMTGANIPTFIQQAFEFKSNPKHEKALLQAVYKTSEAYFVDIITGALDDDPEIAKANKAPIQKAAGTLAKMVDVTKLSTANRDDLEGAIRRSLRGLAPADTFGTAAAIQTKTKEEALRWVSGHAGQCSRPSWSSQVVASTAGAGRFRS